MAFNPIKFFSKATVAAHAVTTAVPESATDGCKACPGKAAGACGDHIQPLAQKVADLLTTRGTTYNPLDPKHSTGVSNYLTKLGDPNYQQLIEDISADQELRRTFDQRVVSIQRAAL